MFIKYLYHIFLTNVKMMNRQCLHITYTLYYNSPHHCILQQPTKTKRFLIPEILTITYF